MFEGTKVQVDKLENGYGIKMTVLANDQNVFKKYVFSTFQAMAVFLDTILGAEHMPFDNDISRRAIGLRSIRDGSQPAQSYDELRDEVSELRRWKSEGIKHRDDITGRLAIATDNLNRALPQIDKLKEENKELCGLVNGYENLNKELRNKLRHRRK